MTFQNRVLPNGEIVAQTWRGSFMGNKGGRIHDPETKSLLKRRWASKRWIICVTEFKNRQRKVMGNGYTELFFTDEVSALSAGHRPCFECRRKEANDFGALWIKVFGKPKGSLADAMDSQLHYERIEPKKRVRVVEALTLPDGVMYEADGIFYAKKGGKFLQWSGNGYKEISLNTGILQQITPPSTIRILRQGYRVKWHPSSEKA